MNYARYTEVLGGVSNVAKKVLNCVPIEEAWSPHQVAIEIRRLTGSSPDMHTLRGCLGALKEAGLVRERQSGFFQQIAPPPRPVPVPIKPTPIKEAAMQQHTSAPQQPKDTQLDKGADLSRRLRELARDANDLAHDLDDYVLENGRKLDQLDQLRKLLKGIE